jgi:hypothetical protein
VKVSYFLGWTVDLKSPLTSFGYLHANDAKCNQKGGMSPVFQWQNKILTK